MCSLPRPTDIVSGEASRTRSARRQRRYDIVGVAVEVVRCDIGGGMGRLGSTA
jgi:hypothetical protein